MPVVKNIGVEDFGDGFLYGETATIDSAAVEIRGGDIEEDTIISVTFAPEDRPAIALAMLADYEKVDSMRVKGLARSTIYDADELVQQAWIFLKAAQLKDAGIFQTAEVLEMENVA